MKRISTLLISVLSLMLMLSVKCHGVNVQLSDSEVELICRFANAAVGEDAPLAVKLGAVNVVLNRLAHSDHPDSVTEVIFQRGAFQCVEDGRINSSFSHSATESARDALRLALLGRDPTEGALYFTHHSDDPLPHKVSFEAGGYLFG